MNDFVVVGLDMDGVVTDSLQECYNRCCEAWKEICGTDYPYSYKDFKGFRHCVHTAEDFFGIPVLADDRPVHEVDSKELYKLRTDRNVQALKDSFYKHRRAKQEEDIKSWMNESPVYDGIPEMIKELWCAKDVKPVIISSKDSRTIEMLLNYHNLRGVNKIYDESVGKRSVQYESAMKDFNVGPENLAVYDDMGDNLRTARNMGIMPIAAPQGFDKPESIAEFRQALPCEFLDILKELLGGIQ